MKYVITDVHKQKMSQATHSTGTIATVAMIALGTGGMDGEAVKNPAGSATDLNKEILRRNYTACDQVDDFCYEYSLVLSEEELVGQSISEMALIDSEGDLICILHFLPKVKDNISETYKIRNRY